MPIPSHKIEVATFSPKIEEEIITFLRGVHIAQENEAFLFYFSANEEYKILSVEHELEKRSYICLEVKSEYSRGRSVRWYARYKKNVVLQEGSLSALVAELSEITERYGVNFYAFEAIR